MPTVAQLKKTLKKRGLSDIGRKAELEARLAEADAAEAGGAADATDTAKEVKAAEAAAAAEAAEAEAAAKAEAAAAEKEAAATSKAKAKAEANAEKEAAAAAEAAAAEAAAAKAAAAKTAQAKKGKSPKAAAPSPAKKAKPSPARKAAAVAPAAAAPASAAADAAPMAVDPVSNAAKMEARRAKLFGAPPGPHQPGNVSVDVGICSYRWLTVCVALADLTELQKKMNKARHANHERVKDEDQASPYQPPICPPTYRFLVEVTTNRLKVCEPADRRSTWVGTSTSGSGPSTCW